MPLSTSSQLSWLAMLTKSGMRVGSYVAFAFHSFALILPHIDHMLLLHPFPNLVSIKMLRGNAWHSRMLFGKVLYLLEYGMTYVAWNSQNLVHLIIVFS